MSEVKTMLCCCPTYRRPKSMLANSIACFLRQEPVLGVRYYLIMLDDGQTHTNQGGDNWDLICLPDRVPTLAAKYPRILEEAKRLGITWDMFVVWDDDDVYLPNHLKNHWQMMGTRCDWSYPNQVWSTYTPPLMKEDSGGRFWGSLAIRREAYQLIGGVPQSHRGDFDQMTIRALRDSGLKRFRPDSIDEPTYVFRWSDSGAPHVQGNIKNNDDPSWYDEWKPAVTDQTNPIEGNPFCDPQFDDSTKRIFNLLGIPLRR